MALDHVAANSLKTVYSLSNQPFSTDLKKEFEGKLDNLQKRNQTTSSVVPFTPEVLSEIKTQHLMVTHAAEKTKKSNVATWVFLSLTVVAIALAVLFPMITLPLAAVFGILTITTSVLHVKSSTEKNKALTNLANSTFDHLQELAKIQESTASPSKNPFEVLFKMVTSQINPNSSSNTSNNSSTTNSRGLGPNISPINNAGSNPTNSNTQTDPSPTSNTRPATPTQNVTPSSGAVLGAGGADPADGRVSPTQSHHSNFELTLNDGAGQQSQGIPSSTSEASAAGGPVSPTRSHHTDVDANDAVPDLVPALGASGTPGHISPTLSHHTDENDGDYHESSNIHPSTSGTAGADLADGAVSPARSHHTGEDDDDVRSQTSQTEQDNFLPSNAQGSTVSGSHITNDDYQEDDQ